MSSPQEIHLHTPRLLLRSMRDSDFEALWHIFTDVNVMAAFDSPPFTQPQMTQWLQRNLAHQLQYGYGLFAVIHKADGLLIGDCGLEMMTLDEALVAELGYDLRSDYWHQGLATEAAAAVRDYAFQVIGLPRLVSLIRVGNEASRRVAEKVGMQKMAEFSRYGQPYWQYGVTNPSG